VCWQGNLYLIPGPFKDSQGKKKTPNHSNLTSLWAKVERKGFVVCGDPVVSNHCPSLRLLDETDKDDNSLVTLPPSCNQQSPRGRQQTNRQGQGGTRNHPLVLGWQGRYGNHESPTARLSLRFVGGTTKPSSVLTPRFRASI